MVNLEIAYNPFLVKTEVVVDGNILTREDSLYAVYNQKRLQDWIERFLREVPKTYREKKINLVFKGTIYDAEDVKEAVKLFEKEDGEININVDDSEAKDITPESKITQLKALFEKAKQGPFEALCSDKIKSRFEEALDPNFEVTVIATMSAGKSTVVNALLGMELMPAKNEACTATIARIEDHDDMDHFEARRQDKNDGEIDGWQDADEKLITKWNDEEDTSLIEIRGNIPAVDEQENVRIVFVDTPGPNNARNSNHSRTTDRAITSKPLSMVLYVLNATQLSTTDDSSLLKKISEVTSSDGRQTHDRFIFIANKIDEFDPEKGESIERVIINVKNYLKENGIENPLVIPTSAQLTKLLRMKRNQGEQFLTRSQRSLVMAKTDLFVEEKDMNMLEHVKNDISLNCYRKLKNRLDNAKTYEDKAEILSGIPIVEELFCQFLNKHAIPAKIRDAVDSLRQIIKDAEELKAINLQLEKGEEELKAAKKMVEGFMYNQNRIEKAQSFRDTLVALKYKPSKEQKIKIENLNKEFEDLKDTQETFFENDINPIKAFQIIDDTQKEFGNFISKLHDELDDYLREEFMSSIEKLRNDYQNFVKDVLDRDFPVGGDESLKKLQEMTMEMISVKELIADSTYSKKECIGTASDSSWWNPFSWGRRKDVYETVENVNMKKTWEDLSIKLRNAFKQNVDIFQQQSGEQCEDAKKQILSSMTDIDQKMDNLLKSLNQATMDKESKEKSLKENRQKIEWYNNFDHELKSLLAI